MKLATWNINSIRIRLRLVNQFIIDYGPDIICFQETKVTDELFPVQELQDMGFPYYVIRGEKSYNGVAIFSKVPIRAIEFFSLADRLDSRHAAVLINDAVELHNFYVPAGGDIPDITINPKFDHKLKFVDQAKTWFKENRDQNDKIILVGDLNIAPLEHDVWSHKQLLNVVSHTPIEVLKLHELQASIGFIDVVRKFVPESEKLYSWWSYRNQDWKKSNRGRRLDHIWATKSLAGQVMSFLIPKEIRDWHNPSDHVPVLIDVEKL